MGMMPAGTAQQRNDHETTDEGAAERGASVVEFALILPVLTMFLLGLVEVGWAHTQNLDSRHGAREGARIAAVNFDDQNTDGYAQTLAIVDEVCDRLDDSDGASVALALETSTDTAVGDLAVITVTKPHRQLTGMFPMFDSIALDSTIEFRLERSATWVDTTAVACL